MRIIITAGPTREAIDPVRFISNRSSGKMGYALAHTALDRGHTVVLVSGPTALPPPEGAECVEITTAQEMLAAVRSHLPGSDALIMAAAVADWRPLSCSPIKLKKRSMTPSLALERTPDILGTLRPDKGSRVHVGFAAETENPVVEARRKLAEKGLDLVVANDVSDPHSGFEVDTNRVTLIDREGYVETLPLMTKREVADAILDRVEALVREAPA